MGRSRYSSLSGRSSPPEEDSACLIDSRSPVRSVGIILLGAVALFAAWKFRSKAVQDVAILLTVIYAFCTAGRHVLAAWINPPGLLALLFLVLACLLIPLGVAPGASLHILLKHLDFVALGLVLPALLCTRRRMLRFLFCSALAITALVVWDLARLVGLYGGAIMAHARLDAHPVLIHPNISSMAAAVAALLSGSVALTQRRCRPLAAVAWLIVALNLLYMVVVKSRGAQIGLLGAVSLTVFFSVRGWRVYLVVTGLVLLGTVVLVLLNPRLTSFGVLDRDLAWHHTASLVGERPLTGYGFGEPVFTHVYHHSDPPSSPHRFFHPHMYWLNTVFCFGWPAALVQAAAWLTVAFRLFRRLPGALLAGGCSERAGVFALLLFVQVVGLVDCMPNVVGLSVYLSIPLALAVTHDWDAMHHV